MKANTQRTPKPTKTWLTIALCFVMIFCGLGLWAQKGLFTVPITEALNIDRTLYSFANTIRYVVTAIVNIFFGYLVNKFGSRKLILVGFTALTLAPFLYGIANNVWLIYLGGACLGIGFSFASTAIVGYVVNKACRKNKGTIMGLVLCANGAAGAIVALIITPIIGAGKFGYRNAFYLLTAISFVALVILLIFFREPVLKEKPEEFKDEKEKKENWEGIEFSVAKKKTYFYLACICILFTGILLTGVTSNYAAHMTDRGVSSERLAVIAVIYSSALAVFKFANGFMYDKFGLRITITLDFIAALGSFLVLYFIDDSPASVYLGIVYAILAGMALPLETVILPIYAKDLFGQKSFAKVLGIFVSLNQVGYALGDPMMNLSFTLTGSYDTGIIISIVLVVVTIIGIQFVINSANKIKKQDFAK